jgi:hypothetical protein
VGDLKIEYLDFIVSQYGLLVDLNKFFTIKYWPLTKIMKSMHVFLRLTCYYYKFVKNYGNIVSPLTSPLKNNAFV